MRIFLSTFYRSMRHLIGAWFFGAIVSTTCITFAQVGAADVVVGEAQPQFELTPEQFDSWVFNGRLRGNQWQTQLKSQVRLQIEAVDQVCQLSEAQKQKLQLASRLDIKRFGDQYEILKQKLQGTKYGQDEINKAYEQIQPLQQIWNTGVLSETSLFNKVLPNTLTAEQVEKYQSEQLTRRKYRYKAKVRLTLATLENSFPLTAKQREQLEKLILAETQPPKKFGQYDHYVVMLQAARLSDEKFKTIFDDAQLRRLKPTLNQAKGMEQMLIQEGWIEVGP